MEPRYQSSLSVRVSRRVVLAGMAGVSLARVSRMAGATGSVPTAYAHPTWLVDATWLMERQDDPNLKVIALTPADEFAAGHIPGALQIDWPNLELLDTSEEAAAVWRENVAAQISALALTPDDTVVIYDGGTLFATRLWWILDYFGHSRKRILDGGIAAWKAVNGPLATGVELFPAATYYQPPRLHRSRFASLDLVADSLDDPDTLLIDVRTPREYEAGHIPGAINIPRTRNAVRSDSPNWKPAALLHALYADAGVSEETLVIPYSREGVRSSTAYFALRLLGHDRVALYTGSWREWSADPTRPRTFGAKP